MAKVLGIDLGTTNSCMAVMDGGDPLVLENSEGARTTPSVVAFSKNGERLVGQQAKRQAVTNPKNTIFSAKRLMGRKFDELSEEEKQLPYEIVKTENGDAHIAVEVEGERKVFSPQEIASMVLAKLKSDAETKLGEKIEEAVVTVPAYFDDAQRNATKAAGEIAGLKVRRVINEPTAASLAYGLDKKTEEKVGVFDLGGGTFDISILEIGDGVFDVLSTYGDTRLGGDDWDNVLIKWVVEDFKNEEGIDFTSQPEALQRIKDEVEKAKIALSTSQTYEINLPFITADQTGPKHIQKTLTRAKLEELTDALFERLKTPVSECLKQAKIGKEEISKLVFVGGMTRMPKVIQTAEEFCEKKAHRGVNPDEVVASGAAIQGGILQGDVKDVVLLDVTPLSLSIETMGNVATPIIERNTTIPVKKSQIFSTAVDGQMAVDIRACQGERKMFEDNKILGNFRLDGIDSAPRGVPQIEVTFDIDSDGIIHVSAKDKATNKEQKISIQGSSGLGKEEIEKAKKDAEIYAEEDKKKLDLAETKNQASSLAYQVEKQLKELGEKFPEDQRKPIEEKIAKVNKALEGDSVEEIKSLVKGLEESLQSLLQAVQKAAQAEGAQTDSQVGEDKKKNPDVVDAEIIDEEEKVEK